LFRTIFLKVLFDFALNNGLLKRDSLKKKKALNRKYGSGFKAQTLGVSAEKKEAVYGQ
jgi:hypothetical protein